MTSPGPYQPTQPYEDPAATDRSTEHPLRRATLVVTKVVTFAVYIYVVFVEIILTLGFVLLLLGANPSSGFVSWIYRSLDRVMRPFRGIFEPVELGLTSGDVKSVFEPSVLFAMIVYAIVALVIHAFLTWLGGRMERLDREDERIRNEQIALAVAARSNPAMAPSYAPGQPGVTQPTTPNAPAQPPAQSPPPPPAT